MSGDLDRLRALAARIREREEALAEDRRLLRSLVRRAVREGWSLRAIARELGVSHTSVERWLSR